MRIGELCAGYGGLGMGIQAVFGGEVIWVADNDGGASQILAHRFPGVPNLGDITTVDWLWEEAVDILAAGFPCQDVSCAGARAGLRAGTRTGVWAHVARAIAELRPPLVILENVRGLLSADADSDMERCPWCLGETGHEHSLRAAGAVCGDLASLGFDAEWVTVSAADAGAPHERKRVFLLAWPAADTDRVAGERAGPVETWGGLVAAVAGGEEPGGDRGPAADAAGARPAGRTGGGGAGAGRFPVVAAGGGAGSAAHPGDGADTERPWGAGWPGRERAPEWGVAGGDRDSDAADSADEEPEPPGGTRTEADRWPAGPVNWGRYAAAIRRWERVTGRRCPHPVEPGRTGPRLSAAFDEWMMGLPEGWVTGVPGLARREQLKALGNGVVPQQAALALAILAGRLDRRILGDARATVGA